MKAIDQYRLVFGIVCMIIGVLCYIKGLHAEPATIEDMVYGIGGTIMWFYGCYVVLDIFADD